MIKTLAVTAPTAKAVGFYEIFIDYPPEADSVSKGSSPSP